MARVNDNIRKLRESHHMTCQQLADAIGCSKSTISRIEGGFIHLTQDKIVALSEFFGVSPNELMNYEGYEVGSRHIFVGESDPVLEDLLETLKGASRDDLIRATKILKALRSDTSK